MWSRASRLSVFIAGAILAAPAFAQGQSVDAVLAGLEKKTQHYSSVAQSIWNYAEVGYQEHKSSALLQSELKKAGFKVEAGVAGMPTGFIATYGSGSPVIGIMGEFDALPGINQTAAPVREMRSDVEAGHACGHHLFGTASMAAAISIKEWLKSTGAQGTIRFYGTPAEEGGAGKVYMVRAGLFDDVDTVLHWHAGNANSAFVSSSLANKSAKFRFTGVSAHAAGAPERGRSALDGVEAMNNMVNMMREHVPQETRIHYVITSGGSAPNVIPDFAEVFYYVRNPDPENVLALFERVVKAAEGAAMGTETKVDYEVIHGIYNVLPNTVLQRMMHEKLAQVGGVTYTAEERAYAEKIYATLGNVSAKLGDEAKVEPFREATTGGRGSTDVGDVSWTAPTAGLRTATWVPGTSSHSWQAVAAGGTSIGKKGMMVAAKTLSLMGIELMTNPQLIAEAKAEFLKRRGPDYEYVPLLGDRDPPLNYRDKPSAGAVE